MKKVKTGCIGMGCRGKEMLKTMLNMCQNAEIAAVCDSYEDRAEEAYKEVLAKTGKAPLKTTNADEIINMKELDAVLIFAAWESHVPLAVAAMESGKYVGVEVGGAYSTDDCRKLVETYEKTGVPCMLLENCCYGVKELSVLRMVREGVFGRIVHCSGGYHHDLREEVAGGDINRHYRLRNYLNRNCENYPTHELGPIAKVLDINRGNRMVSLVSVASGAFGMEDYIKRHADKYPALQGVRFKQADIVNTVITCADGATILLTLDTTLPRSYSRAFTVRGTHAAYQGLNDSLFIDGVHSEAFSNPEDMYWGNGKEYREKYMHPLWAKYGEKAKAAGHDGMDYMVLSAFFEAVLKKTQTPIDVYDAAAWMCITPLSEESIKKGGAPVEIPDFTNGRWKTPEKAPSLEFALD